MREKHGEGIAYRGVHFGIISDKNRIRCVYNIKTCNDLTRTFDIWHLTDS